MTRIGYTLMSEQYGPTELREQAEAAEAAGFDYVTLSDHYHPWIPAQGESPFAWGVLGAIAGATEDVEVGTAVTCPTIRIHPAIIAQAAATAAIQFEDRFFLGIGTGERLNEHVLGDQWPPHTERVSMLAEAIHVIRRLWEGEVTSHDGEHYTVENARLFTTPAEPPPIHVAAGGEETAEFAGRHGDGLITTAPAEDEVDSFADEFDGDAPVYGQTTVCYAEDEETAAGIAHEYWPNGVLPGELGQELAIPEHFLDAVELVDVEDVAESMTLGSDPGDHVDIIEAYVDAGFDHVAVHQVNPDAEGFFEFYAEEVLPAVS
jgi:G6PDH family F420-dependent oxidoreductase